MHGFKIRPHALKYNNALILSFVYIIKIYNTFIKPKMVQW